MNIFAKLITVSAIGILAVSVNTTAQAQYYPGAMYSSQVPMDEVPQPQFNLPDNSAVQQGMNAINIYSNCGGDPSCIAASSGLVPRDGMIVAQIVQECGGQPVCVATQWSRVELERCSNGIGVSGGCFGPNGEIMKVLDRALPQNLHPDVIARNIDHDIHKGPGEHNDIVGRKGWLRKRLGF